jgi:hypothetical protein
MSPRAAFLALALAGAALAGEPSAGPRPFLMGFTPFPYDMTLEAVDKTWDFVRKHSDIVAIHIDGGGVPWTEALADKPFPGDIEGEWKKDRAKIPAGYPVYLALMPLDQDRIGLARNRTKEKEQPLPPAFKGKTFGDAVVRQAYLNYCRRAVRAFRPDYLNIAVECTNIALQKPGQWPVFADFCRFIRSGLKKEWPNLSIGVSHELQKLWTDKVAERVRPTLKDMDYLGLSFYPYGDPFGARYKARRLPKEPEQWRSPLGWVRGYTDMPIAICETGYITKKIHVKEFDLRMEGDETRQEWYIRELMEIARRDRYLFVINYLAVDYDKLSARFPAQRDLFQLWESMGFLDSGLRAKPALKAWDAALAESR